tara:strand:+ start:1332 stop:1856 length:525 start_codon:yes stop_codon:yes gene_type:complete
MAGALIKIDSDTSGGSVSELKVTGIDSTYNVYIVHYSIRPVDNDKDLYIKTTTSGTADSDSQYDEATLFFRADASFADTYTDNATQWYGNAAMANDSDKLITAQMFLFNFPNSSEYSYMTHDASGYNDTIPGLVGEIGGGVHTVAEANDGIALSWESSSNFASGSKVTLYGLKK